MDLPFPEGRDGKYFRIANYAHSSGWGNVMQNLLLNAYLAYSTGRSFVFYNYTWNTDGSNYSNYNGKLIPSKVPLSTLLGGPIVGEPFPAGIQVPRAVAKEYWDEVCPSPKVVRNDDILASLGRESTAGNMIDKWNEVLNSTEDRCVEVAGDSYTIFDIFIFGDPRRLLDAWPRFSTSPILTHFALSPLVELAFDTNRDLISPPAVFEPYVSSMSSTLSAERYAPIPGLLALHIRRAISSSIVRTWRTGKPAMSALTRSQSFRTNSRFLQTFLRREDEIYIALAATLTSGRL
ncbi:hypothetical protein AcW1_001342 [Taiwanofungus camphoratus]|nr:hypothetical protein AcW1_001342 [Antrodia cinnamomea]